MFKNIIWATDGSEAAERALPTAIELAKDSGAKLIVVHADEHMAGRGGGYSMLADEDGLRARIRAKVAELGDAGLDADLRILTCTATDPADLVTEAARKIRPEPIV